MEHYRPGLGRNQNLVSQLKEFQRNPKSLIFVALADTYRAQSLPLQALEILDEGLVHHPHNMSAILARGKCLFDLRRYADAMAEVKKVLQANPENLRAYKFLAEIYVRLGQRRAAIRSLAKVVSLFPQDLEAVRSLKELENLEFGTNVPPETVMRVSTDFAPVGKIEEFQVGSFSDSMAAIGVSAPVEKVEAIEVAEVAVADDDSEPAFATRTIAELYLRQGLKAKAKKVIKKILANDPTHQWAREALQDLGTDGIVARPKGPSRSDRLEQKVKILEKFLSRIRLLKNVNV